MLSKCANPSCHSIFRYLHEGKVFRLERRHDNDPNVHAKDFEYFWLCSTCAAFLTIVFEQDGIQVRSSRLQLASGAVALMPVQTWRAA
jgi:hypothetical protein